MLHGRWGPMRRYAACLMLVAEEPVAAGAVLQVEMQQPAVNHLSGPALQAVFELIRVTGV